MLAFNQLVKQKIILARAKNSGVLPEVHIAYGADNNFSTGTSVSAASVLNNNPQLVPHFHIFTDCVSAEFVTRWQEYARQRDYSMTVYLIDTDALSALPVKARWPSAIYFRIVAIDYLADAVERLLYLDSDIICCNSIAGLMNIGMGNDAVAACLDIDFIEEGERVALMNAPQVRNKYFNSGVLLINGPAWRQQAISENIVRGLCDPQIKDALLYYDQDLINIAVAGRVHFLDDKYNVQYSLNDEYKGSPCALAGNIVFLHYIGATKPWHEWASAYPSAAPFLAHKSRSPWRDAPPVGPHKKILWRHALRHARHQRRWASVIRYGLGLLAASLRINRGAGAARPQPGVGDSRRSDKPEALRE